jgi:hypothetical protein
MSQTRVLAAPDATAKIRLQPREPLQHFYRTQIIMNAHAQSRALLRICSSQQLLKLTLSSEIILLKVSLVASKRGVFHIWALEEILISKNRNQHYRSQLFSIYIAPNKIDQKNCLFDKQKHTF